MPWLLAEVPKLARLPEAPAAARLAALFHSQADLEWHGAASDATADVGIDLTPATAAAPVDVKEAQHMLLEEASRCAVSRAPAALVRAATEHGRSCEAPARWQWAAFQHVLYGCECYTRLLRHLPSCVQTLHLASACVVVQRAYRQRLGRKMMRLIREQRERTRKEAEVRGRTHADWSLSPPHPAPHSHPHPPTLTLLPSPSHPRPPTLTILPFPHPAPHPSPPTLHPHPAPHPSPPTLHTFPPLSSLGSRKS